MPKQEPDYLSIAKLNVTMPKDLSFQQAELRAAVAVASATIALADELRTANLIAFLGTLEPGDQGIRDLRVQIVDRLGLA